MLQKGNLDPLTGSERGTVHARTDSTSSRASVIRQGSSEGQAITPYFCSSIHTHFIWLNVSVLKIHRHFSLCGAYIVVC